MELVHLATLNTAWNLGLRSSLQCLKFECGLRVGLRAVRVSSGDERRRLLFWVGGLPSASASTSASASGLHIPHAVHRCQSGVDAGSNHSDEEAGGRVR